VNHLQSFLSRFGADPEFTYAPSIRLLRMGYRETALGGGQEVRVVFDSTSSFDIERAAQVSRVFVPNASSAGTEDHLVFVAKVERTEKPGALRIRVFLEGAALLQRSAEKEAEMSDASPKSVSAVAFLVGQSVFESSALVGPGKPLTDDRIGEIAAIVRNSVADAGSNAFAEYFGGKSARETNVVPLRRAEAAEVAPASAPRQRSAMGWLKLTAAAFAASVLIVVAASHVFKPPSSTGMEAVASTIPASALNPDNPMSQVELTKAALRDMGLDPGKAANIGCLTQPQPPEDLDAMVPSKAEKK